MKLLSKIKCKRKYLIIGNHDKWQQYKEIDPDMFLDIQYYIEDICDQGAVFHLMHYPLLSFKHMRRSKTFMLHGHIHSDGNYNLENKANHILRYDVGVDSNNFFPVSTKQILEFFGEEEENTSITTISGYNVVNSTLPGATGRNYKIAGYDVIGKIY